MKKNPVKAALKAGQPQIGTWISLGNLTATRLMARTGFPFLTLDLEHSPIDWENAAALMGAIADADCVPLARVPEGRHHYIKRALDSGAFGVIVPMVESVSHAKECIAAAKYPPQGTRSLGGSLSALNFAATAGDYYKYANNEVLVVLQIESPRGVACTEEICALPGLDAIFVGTNDLRAQMRSADGRDPSTEEYEAALQRILAAGKKAGCAVGLFVMTVEETQKRVKEGWQLIGLASELRMMVSQAQKVAGELGLSNQKRDLARY
jgi:4-hydroxy-2-oxoheptanedioate aldolase